MWETDSQTFMARSPAKTNSTKGSRGLFADHPGDLYMYSLRPRNA